MGNKKAGAGYGSPSSENRAVEGKMGGISFGKTRFHQAEDEHYKGGHCRWCQAESEEGVCQPVHVSNGAEWSRGGANHHNVSFMARSYLTSSFTAVKIITDGQLAYILETLILFIHFFKSSLKNLRVNNTKYYKRMKKTKDVYCSVL